MIFGATESYLIMIVIGLVRNMNLIENDQDPLLLRWINFDPSMEK